MKSKEEQGNVILTGDTHGSFERLSDFCMRFSTRPSDVMVILGDAGFNFWQDERDRRRKEYVSGLPLTVFCVHGNHEIRPERIPSYRLMQWRGGQVWVEDEFPNILFAKDGEIYRLNGNRVLVIGGAYSIDKDLRLSAGYGWWEDEQPSDEIRQRVERRLEEANWCVDTVLTHTVPLKYEPTECFMSCVDQSRVDKSTEKWLDSIEDRLQYRNWFSGHYHVNKTVDRLTILFDSYRELPPAGEEPYR